MKACWLPCHVAGALCHVDGMPFLWPTVHCGEGVCEEREVCSLVGESGMVAPLLERLHPLPLASTLPMLVRSKLRHSQAMKCGRCSLTEEASGSESATQQRCAAFPYRGGGGGLQNRPCVVRGGGVVKAEGVCRLLLPVVRTCTCTCMSWCAYTSGGNPPLVDRWVGCPTVGLGVSRVRRGRGGGALEWWPMKASSTHHLPQ